MKRFSILIALTLFVSQLAFSQSVSKTSNLISNTSGKYADTLANAATKNQTLKIEGFADMVSVQSVLTKISGTTAGKVYLLGSIDGTNYVRAGGSDSLTVANVAIQTKIFDVAPSKYLFYRIQFTGTGTQSTRFNSVALIRKR